MLCLMWFFFFYKTLSFSSLPRSTWSCQSTTSDMSSHGRNGEMDPEAEPGQFMPLLDKGVRWAQHTGTTPHTERWRTKVLFHSSTLDITDNAVRSKIRRLKAPESVPGITRINIYLVKWHVALKLRAWIASEWVCTHSQESKGTAMLHL